MAAAKRRILDLLAHAASRSRRRSDLLLATLFGVSWFLLARASYHLALWLHPVAPGVGWRPLLGSIRLVLGAVLYLPAARLVLRKNREPVPVGLGLRATRWGLARGLALVVLSLVANLLLQPRPEDVWRRLVQHIGEDWLSLGKALQPPLVEEFLARGLVWGLAARSWPSWVAVAWSTALFGSWHLEQGLASTVSITICALPLFAGPRLLSGSIWPGAALHLFTNAGLVLPTLWTAILWCLSAWLWDRRLRVPPSGAPLRPGQDTTSP